MPYNISRRLFFFVLIFSPLAFGAVEPWSLALMETGAAAALFLYIIHSIKQDGVLYQVPGLFFLMLFLGYILFQVVPLPYYVVKFLSPSSFEIQQNAASITGNDSLMTLSVHPGATTAEFFRYSAYAVFYILIVQLFTQKDILRKTIFVIALFAGLLAFSSILQYYLTDNMAFWFREVPENASTMGPYVNRNHYAGLMEMALPLILALFLFYKPRVQETSFFRGIVEILTQEKANIHILIGTCVILVATSIFVCLSRGGIISAGLSLLIFVFLLAKRQMTRKGTVLVFLVTVLLVLSVSWFGWNPVFERFAELQNEQNSFTNGRLNYWRDGLNLTRDFKLTGAGFGTFGDIYPFYQSISEDNFVKHAHNDYIELAAEGGVIAFVLVAGFMGTILRRSYQVFKTRRDAWSIHIYIGAVTGVAALLFHSVSDFNLHIGANGLWFFFLLGLAVSAANTRMRTKQQATKLDQVTSPGVKKAAVVFSAVFLAAVAVFGTTRFLGDFYYANMEDYEISLQTPQEDLKKMRDIASYASLFDPLSAEYAYAKADTSWLLGDREAAEREFFRAIDLNPSNALYHKRYGMFLSHAGEKEKALEPLENSVRYAPVNSDNALEYGALLVYQGRYDKGLQYLKKAVELNKGVTSQVLTTMVISGFSLEQMRRAVPDTPEAAVAFAGFLRDTGEFSEAEAQYLHALDLMESMDDVKPKHLYAVYRFFLKYDGTRKALEVMKRGEAIFPSDPGIKITIGDLYKKQGVLYKATDKYEQALMVDPGNRRALKRLNQ
ncbi:MAG: O-antigen ligase family protein [Desulfobacteraceae bacterium]